MTNMYPFDTFSQDMMNHFLPGQRAMQDIAAGTALETVTAGVTNPLTVYTDLSVTGTQAYTLADGPAGIAGLTKVYRCTVAASTPAGTLTIASPETTAGMVTSATFVFHTVGQELHLAWSGSKWRCIKTVRAGVKIAVIGTTVLTGFNLCNVLSCSVTGTVSSTGANAVPNGQYPGDFLIVACSTAASTPIGNINFAGLTLANVAATDLQAIGATTDTVSLLWNGLAWSVIANAGITVA
jgi:hypothetical protein